MDKLRSLARLIDKHKIKQIDIVGLQTSSSPTKLYQLYEGLVSGDITSDETAIARLYGNAGDSQDEAGAFKKLKQRLEYKLCNTLFFIDQNEAKFNNTSSAYYHCHRSLAAFKIMIGKGVRKAAIPFGEKAFRQAVKFGITSIAADLANDLRNHFAVNEADEKKFEKYDRMAEQYNQLRQAELRAESLYANIMVKVTAKRSSDPEWADKAGAYATQLEHIKRELPLLSFRFIHLFYLIKALQFEIRNDLPNLIKVCEEAQRTYEDPALRMPPASCFNIGFRLLQAFTQTQQFDKAHRVLDYCNTLVPEGSANWFLLRYAEVVLGFYADDFDRAYTAYRTAVDHKAYDQQYRMAAERWMMTEGYIQYLIAAGKIQLQDPFSSPKKFRLQRFLNDFIVFSKDKTGYNVDLIVLQVLFLLQKRDYEAILDRIDSWQKYASRYLNKSENKRSRIFLKMIFRLPKYFFKRTLVENKTKPIFERLQGVSFSTPQVTADPEMIPYETLWTFVLDSLDDRIH